MNTKYAVCLENKGYKHSLEIGKLYEIIPDEKVENRQMIRVIGEEGEDYLYEAKNFYPLIVPKDLAIALHERI